MQVRSAINKANGKIADAGSVLFNFKRMGVISIAATREDGSSVTEDEVNISIKDDVIFNSMAVISIASTCRVGSSVTKDEVTFSYQG